MSFIDMMADRVWTDAEIINRTEAMVRAVVSVADELVLNRKVQGAALGQYTLTAEDQAQMALLAQAGYAAQQEGIAARYDMLVLQEVLLVEEAEKVLSNPDASEDDKTRAQERIDVADDEVMGWVRARRPVVDASIKDPIETQGQES